MMDEQRISDWSGLTYVLRGALDRFETLGCRVTDHAFIKFGYSHGDS